MFIGTALKIILFSTFFATINSIENESGGEGGFLFTLPRVLRAGRRETSCLSLHDARATIKADVTINVATIPTNKIAVTRKVFDAENVGCFEVKVPETTDSKAKIHLQVKFSNESINSIDEVTIIQSTAVTFVQTDKEIYKPGDRVKIRILTFTTELTVPKNLLIPIVKIRNPNRIAIGQWENVTTELGLVQLEHQLSQETMLGEWVIELPINNAVFKHFSVKEYVLPRFEVIINHPKSFYINVDSFDFLVCAKYSYGRAVKGTNHMKIQLLAQDLTVNQIKELKNGCANFSFNRTEVPIINKFMPIKLKLVATVTEQGTGQLSSTESEVEISDEKYMLKFINTPQFFQNGLPYKGQLKVLHSFEDLTNKSVRICYNFAVGQSWNLTEEECEYFVLNNKNYTDFVIFPFESRISLIRLKASLDETNILYHNVYQWFSPSNSFIQISYERLTFPMKCKSWQTFTILYTLNSTVHNSSPIIFNYLIKSKGNILKFGKVAHTPCSTQSFNVNDYKHPVGNITHLLKPKLLIDKFILTVKIHQKMYSNAELLVYYVRNDGEIVGTSVQFDVENCLTNKVDAYWTERQNYPGEITSYKIKAAAGSLCAVSATDKKNSFLSQPVHLTINNLLKYVQRPDFYHTAREKCIADSNAFNEEDSLPYWDLKRKKRFLKYGSDLHDTLQMFYDAKLLVMTDLKIVTRPCSNYNYKSSALDGVSYLVDSNQILAPYETQPSDKGIVIRSNFPETWLWDLISIGRSGETQLKSNLPHSITEWIGNTVCVSPSAGVGVSSSANITAFKPFFVEVITPYAMKRNEITHVQLIVHNYLNHSLPIGITLSVNEEIQTADSSDETFITKCLEPNDSVTDTFRMTALSLGRVNFSITAEVDSAYPGECGPEVLLNRRDVVVKSILVQPEGFPSQRTISNFICANNTKDEEMKWNIEVPYDTIKNSSRLKILLDTDLLELTIENLGSLLNIPTGCGEQIIATLAPNLYVLRYLNTTGNLSPEIEKKARNFIRIGYERIQQYRHKDGSFSAFGDQYGEGSMFLTAFILRTLSLASKYIYIDRDIITRASAWIIERQVENGCFPETLNNFNPAIANENDVDNIALTAYVLISLMESNNSVAIPIRVRDNAKFCLRGYNSADKYTMAIITYALTLVEWESEASRSLERMLEIANRKDGLLWWQDTESLPNSLEMTSYMILSLSAMNISEYIALAHDAVRWLLTKRNSNGGFISTQDTVVALDALTKFAAIARKNNTNVTVSIATGAKHFSFRMRNNAKLKTKQIALSKFSSFIKFNVTGTGCLLIQTVLRYNMPQIISSEALKLIVTTNSVSTIDKCTITQLSSCFSYDVPNKHINMAVLEISLPSGYKADRKSLFELTKNSQTRVQRFEENENKVMLYFTKITSEKICVPFLITEESIIENRTNTIVHLYDYYNPNISTFSNYSLLNCENLF